MFHRTMTNPQGGLQGQDSDQLDYPQERPREPQQQTFPYQSKMIEQSALERYAMAEAAKKPAREEIANQSQPLTDSQFYVYESSLYPEEKDTQAMTPAEDMKSDSKIDQSAMPSRIDIPGGVFSRPGQAAPIAGRAPYPGAYPGATPFGAQNPATANDPATGRKLYIGQGITLSGEIESCDHLVVEGTVEAALKGASILEIAEAGAYFGTVDIDEATIAGRFEGDLTVRGRLTIKASGSITGSISYKELAAEAGATIDGKLSPLDGKTSAASTTRKVSKPKTNDYGAELPFEGKAVAAE